MDDVSFGFKDRNYFPEIYENMTPIDNQLAKIEINRFLTSDAILIRNKSGTERTIDY